MDVKALEDSGFVHDDDMKSAHTDNATKNGMSDFGPYVVHGVWRKGLVTVLCEQNTAPEPMGGGMSAIISHPAVCVVSGPNGKAACNAEDTELILVLATELA